MKKQKTIYSFTEGHAIFWAACSRYPPFGDASCEPIASVAEGKESNSVVGNPAVWSVTKSLRGGKFSMWWLARNEHEAISILLGEP